MDYCQDCERFVEADKVYQSNDPYERVESMEGRAYDLMCPYCGGDNIVTPQEDDWREAL